MRALTAALLLLIGSIASPRVSAHPAACPIPDRPLTPAPPGQVDPAGYFPATYQQGRTRFRTACGRAVAAYAGYCQAITIANRAGQDLTIDIAYVSAGSKNLLILQSGLHGAEGFAGSAVQARVLEQRIPTLLSSGFDVAMIHAVNPYGFANTRRVDECNIDLNRNFANHPDMYRTEHNLDYERLRTLTERPRPVEDPIADKIGIKVDTAIAALFAGEQAVAEGTHRGQYHDPAGFEFGGWAPAPQMAILRNQLGPLLKQHSGDVYFFDLHTGLGPSNALTLISGANWPKPRVDRLRDLTERAQAAWGASSYVAGSGRISAEGPCDSRFSTSGDVIDFVPTLTGDDRIMAVTAEWGTVGASTAAELETNARQTLEHQAYFYGCGSPEACRRVRAEYAELFNPPDPRFQAAVLSQFDAILDTLPHLARGAFRGFGKIPFAMACRP